MGSHGSSTAMRGYSELYRTGPYNPKFERAQRGETTEMILGAEIALLVMGLYALFAGKLTLTKQKVVRGTPARLLGILCLLPIPLSLLVGIVLGVGLAVQGQTVTENSVRWM